MQDSQIKFARQKITRGVKSGFLMVWDAFQKDFGLYYKLLYI